MRDTILLTGGTGALGQMLLPRLLAKGHKVVCLVRAPDTSSARRRVSALVGAHPNIKVIRGDITEPRCGINDLDQEQLFGRVKRILHSAASLDFEDREKTLSTNVGGVHHVIELADRLDAWNLMHVSTAYIAGDAKALCETDLYVGQRWRNVYEESKHVGETMVRAWALKRDDRRITIFRPSILFGAKDGYTPTFDGYYTFTGAVARVAAVLRARAENLPHDVFVGRDGEVVLPLVMQMSRSTVNYIPIDWVADAMVRLVDTPPSNKTYHLVHDRPPRIREMTAWSLEFLKIKGMRIVDTEAEKRSAAKLQSAFVRNLQRRLDAVHKAYVPYCTTDPDFACEHTWSDLGTMEHPALIDQAYVNRSLAYATAHNWGRPSKTRQLIPTQ